MCVRAFFFCWFGEPICDEKAAKEGKRKWKRQKQLTSTYKIMYEFLNTCARQPLRSAGVCRSLFTDLLQLQRQWQYLYYFMLSYCFFLFVYCLFLLLFFCSMLFRSLCVCVLCVQCDLNDARLFFQFSVVHLELFLCQSHGGMTPIFDSIQFIFGL